MLSYFCSTLHSRQLTYLGVPIRGVLGFYVHPQNSKHCPKVGPKIIVEHIINLLRFQEKSMLRSAGNGLCRVSGPPIIRHDYVLASVLPEILEKSHANFRFSTFINSQFLIQS